MRRDTWVHSSDARLSSSRSSHAGSDSGGEPQASGDGQGSVEAAYQGIELPPRSSITYPPGAIWSYPFSEAVPAAGSTGRVTASDVSRESFSTRAAGEQRSDAHLAYVEETVIAMMEWALIAMTAEMLRRSVPQGSLEGSQLSMGALRSRREHQPTQSDAAPRKSKGASNALSRRRNNPQQTLILRHIPCRIREGQVRDFLDQHGFQGTYSSVAVPVDHRTEGNRGYAFVKFRSDEDLGRGLVELAGKRFPGGSSEKVTATDVAVGRGRG